jgi:hypothetical protein
MIQTVSSLTGSDVLDVRISSGTSDSYQSGDFAISFTGAAAPKSFSIPQASDVAGSILVLIDESLTWSAANPFTITPVAGQISGQTSAAITVAGAAIWIQANGATNNWIPLLNPGLFASKASMPVPSTVVPPPVAITGAVGVGTPYARMDHTHTSLVQTDQISVPAGSSPLTVTWNFPNATLYSSPPKVIAQVVTSSGATQPIVVNVVNGTVTATSAQFRIFVASTVSVAILGVNVNIFSGTVPAGILLNCYAHA